MLDIVDLCVDSHRARRRRGRPLSSLFASEFVSRRKDEKVLKVTWTGRVRESIEY